MVKIFTNKTSLTTAIDEWIADSNIQRKDRADIIAPPMYCPPNVLNLWKPSKFEGRDVELTNERYNKDAVDAWINHVDIICDHDADVKEHVINYFAHMLQKPAEKPETSLNIEGSSISVKDRIKTKKAISKVAMSANVAIQAGAPPAQAGQSTLGGPSSMGSSHQLTCSSSSASAASAASSGA